MRRLQSINKLLKVKVIEIEVMIVDKISNAFVHRGSSLNIMAIQTMEKLGLSLIELLSFVINIENQCSAKSIEQIKNCKIITWKKKYVLTFYMIYMYTAKGSFYFTIIFSIIENGQCHCKLEKKEAYNHL